MVATQKAMDIWVAAIKRGFCHSTVHVGEPMRQRCPEGDHQFLGIVATRTSVPWIVIEMR